MVPYIYIYIRIFVINQSTITTTTTTTTDITKQHTYQTNTKEHQQQLPIQRTNISHPRVGTFWEYDFPFSKVGYVSFHSSEGYPRFSTPPGGQAGTWCPTTFSQGIRLGTTRGQIQGNLWKYGMMNEINIFDTYLFTYVNIDTFISWYSWYMCIFHMLYDTECIHYIYLYIGSYYSPHSNSHH